jgi:cardiolipin synthase (CMP-forming)
MDSSASTPAASRATKPKGQRAAELALSLPNILTYFRIAAVPAVVACLYFLSSPTARWAALFVYGIACVTDWLDGYLARIWQQQSALGRMLDPIADKLLVGATLLILTHDNTINGVHIWAAVIILCREILVSGLREFLAELNVKIHVTQLAKWKTTLQMIALAVLLAGPAADAYVPHVTSVGLGLLWIAALLTLLTGYDYLRAAVRHAMTD